MPAAAASSGFPYGVVYEADDAEVLIIAVANLHRRPDYWRKSRSG